MKRISTATGLLALGTLFMFGAVSAESASAVAQFLWTGQLPALVLVLSKNKQVIASVSTLGVVCEHFAGHGILSNGKAMTSKEFTITGNYTECKFGTFPVIVSPAELLINADGSVAIVGRPIVVTIPTLACSVKIANGGANGNLKTLRYLNLKDDILAHAELTGIASLGSSEGTACGDPSVENTEGTYSGLLLFSVDGGTVRWDP